jgi:hypothetical protein
MFELLLLKKKKTGVINEGFGVVGGGRTVVSSTFVYLANTYNYVFTNDAVTGGNNLSFARYDLGAASNGQYAIFAGGTNSTSFPLSNTDKLTFSNLTIAVSTQLPIVRRSFAATSTDTFAYFATGISTGSEHGLTLATTSNKYNYSNDAIISGASTTRRSQTAAAGNLTFGVFDTGAKGYYDIRAVEKYRYSNDTVSAGTFSPTSYSPAIHAAAGNETFAIFAGGYLYGPLTYTTKYTYSNDARISTTSLPVGMYEHCGFGNKALIIFTHGDITRKFSLVNETYATGTKLLASSYLLNPGAASSSPGWVV